MYWSIRKFSTKYICYTQSVKESLLSIFPNEDYLAVDNNTIYNPYSVQPMAKTGREKGILFIGRLRQNCGIELLIKTVSHFVLSMIMKLMYILSEMDRYMTLLQ